MQTKFIPIDYDYFDWQGRNYAKIIGRDEKGKRLCIVDSCDVYLWTILEKDLDKNKINKLIEKISKIKLDVKGRKTKVEKVELHERNFLDKPVKALKVFATNYKDLHDIADNLGIKGIEKRRGYDLGYITHYIKEKQIKPLYWYEIEGEILDNSEEFGGIGMHLDVDKCIHLKTHKEIKSENYIPKVLAYDIETEAFQIGKGEILMISLVGKNYRKVITSKKTSEKLNYVEYVKDEAELLEKFVEEVRSQDTDILAGYFSDGFDLPYIKARAEKNQVKLKIGLDDSQPKFHRGAILTGKINGIVHVDLLRFIQTAYAQYMQSETLSLNDVANEFLGERKRQFEFRSSEKIDSKGWKEYFEYNLQDSVLTYKLFEKFWPDMMEFSKTVQEPIFDITRAGLSKYVEGYILHNLEKFKEIPEKRPGHDEISNRKRRGPVEGAFVLETQPGLYEDIAIFDFTSMHTSIIISMNISGSTLQTEEENSNTIETKLGKFSFTKKPGFIPLLLKEIFEKRKKFKAEYNKNPNLITKARSNAFKVLSASVHGYIGFFGARYYSLESSSSILAYVRKFNKETIKNIEKKGYKVIFSDTDSVGFVIGNKSKKEIKELLEELNSKLPGIMELELEGFFKRGLWVTKRTGKVGAKKKYALIGEDGKLKIRGFETVRRDWCQLSRELQNEVIKMILEDGNEKRALDYLKKIVKKVKTRDVDKKSLIIRTQLKKPLSEYKAISPHVIAARKMKEQKIPLSQGALIEYYLAETKSESKLVRDKVKLPNEEGTYEIKYYLERQILPAVENIFQVFNINLKEIIDGKKQTKLGDF